MKKLFGTILSLFGPLGTVVAILAALACLSLFARSAVRSFSQFVTPVIVEESGGDAIIQKFEAKFQYKPLLVFDSDIIVLPSREEGGDILPNGEKTPARKYARMELQYSGYAEYVVDLDISPENVKTNEEGKIVSIQLHRPRCPLSSVKWMDAADQDRWFKIDGTDDEWKEFYQMHVGQFVTACIHKNANTDANRRIAEKQTLNMVNAMIGTFIANPSIGVEIVWLDNP